MHILESYALQDNLKIDRPHIYEKFFPLAVDKYITLDTSSLGTHAMKYSYWQLVVDLILPKLNEQGIKIVQLGEKDCVPLTNCYLAIGQCNFNQKCYVINKSLAHLSVNNETLHIASALNKKIVTLFPYNCYYEQFSPYWSDENDVDLCWPKPLQDKGRKPSFNPSESPKSIDSIMPEEVALKILKKVGIHTFAPEYKTIRVGSSFRQPRIESNLSHLIDVKKLGVPSLIVRMDLNFNEKNLIDQLKQCPCSVITNKPLSDEILEKYSKNIVELVYYIEDDNDPNFIKKVKSKSITFLMRTRKTGDTLSDLKLDYFDYGMIQQVKEKSKDDFEELKNQNNLYYKSKHFIIHDNKFYPCTAALKRLEQGSQTMEHTPQKIIDDPVFWEEEEHFQFFTKR